MLQSVKTLQYVKTWVKTPNMSSKTLWSLKTLHFWWHMSRQIWKLSSLSRRFWLKSLVINYHNNIDSWFTIQPFLRPMLSHFPVKRLDIIEFFTVVGLLWDLSSCTNCRMSSWKQDQFHYCNPTWLLVTWWHRRHVPLPPLRQFSNLD